MCFFFSSRRRHTRFDCDWSSDVCSSDLKTVTAFEPSKHRKPVLAISLSILILFGTNAIAGYVFQSRSEEHTSELQSQSNLVCRLLLEKKKQKNMTQP